MALDISSVTYPEAPDDYGIIRLTFSDVMTDGDPWDLTKFSMVPTSGGNQPNVLAVESVAAYPDDLLVLGQFNDLIGGTFSLDYIKDGIEPTIEVVGDPIIVAPGVTGWGAGALKVSDLAVSEGVKWTTFPVLGSLVQTGTIRFRYKPNYSGTPASTQSIISIIEFGGLNNLINISHTDANKIGVVVSDSTGTTIVFDESNDWPSGGPTAGVWYDLELDFDVTTGATRFFLDGNQIGSTFTDTGTRSASADYMEVGIANGPDFVIDSVQILKAVLHTANFTPPTQEILASGGASAVDVSISTLTGESGLNDYEATIEAGFISNYLDAANDTLDAPNNDKSFTGQVEPFKIEELETINATTLRLHFNRSFQIIDDLLDPTKYTLSGGLSVFGVAVVSNTELDLYTSEQDPGESYTLTVTP